MVGIDYIMFIIIFEIENIPECNMCWLYDSLRKY